MAFFLATINAACRWGKWTAKKNILYIAKVVTFEATSKFWGMKYRWKRCNKRTCWTRIKALPVGVDVVSRYSLFVGFCALSSSCCCIIVSSSPYFMIICFLSSRFYTSSFSSCYSANASWAYMGDLIYHLFGTYFLRSIFDRQFRKVVLLVLQQYSEYCLVIRGWSKPFVDRWTYD